MAKVKIELFTEEEIICKARALGGGRSYLVKATKAPYQDCNILACVLNGQILNWSVYCGEDWCGIYFKNSKDAVQYLKDCEK